MSRIGKKTVPIPQGVEVKIDKQIVTTKGKLGTLSRPFHKNIHVSLIEKGIQVEVKNSERRENRALWGLSRSLLSNMVTGVSQGFSRVLEIQGIGYRASIKGKTLQLILGFSHPINYNLPDGVTAKVERNTLITVSGMNPEVIGQACADIRAFRPPEPYKGKGVRYAGEYVVKKEGKKK